MLLPRFCLRPEVDRRSPMFSPAASKVDATYLGVDRTKLGPQTPHERRGTSCSAACTLQVPYSREANADFWCNGHCMTIPARRVLKQSLAEHRPETDPKIDGSACRYQDDRHSLQGRYLDQHPPPPSTTPHGPDCQRRGRRQRKLQILK